MDYGAGFVIWIKSDSIATFCPLCLQIEVHAHIFQDNQIDKVSLTMLKALCSREGDTYRAIFPQEISCGLEKNWAAGRLDVVGLDLSELEIEGTWMSTKFEIPEPPSAGTLTDKRSTGRSSIRMKRRIVLGDMRKIISVRVKPNVTHVTAPLATFGGVPLLDPLGILHARRYIHGKTYAVLDRGEPFDPVIAVSGWQETFTNTKNALRQTLWVNEVFKISEYVGHKLKPKGRDMGRPGQVKASHAEKQLIAFVVRIHRFLDDGFDPVYMYKLRNLLPDLREVRIAIDNDPCDDCMRFRDKVEAVLKIKIHFEKMKKESTFGTYLHDLNIQSPRTSTTAKTGELSLSTPPNSGEKLPLRLPDDDFMDSDNDDEYSENSDSIPSHSSPRLGRTLRFLGTPQRPITIPASPPSTPMARTSRRAMFESAERRMEMPPQEFLRHKQPTASSLPYAAAASVNAENNNNRPSSADINAAITEAFDAMARRENDVGEEEEVDEEYDDSGGEEGVEEDDDDSDEEVDEEGEENWEESDEDEEEDVWRRGVRRKERNIIDLTIDDSTIDDADSDAGDSDSDSDSEGSIFLP